MSYVQSQSHSIKCDLISAASFSLNLLRSSSAWAISLEMSVMSSAKIQVVNDRVHGILLFSNKSHCYSLN